MSTKNISFQGFLGLKNFWVHYIGTQEITAITDKPREAFVQTQWCDWPKNMPHPHWSPCRIWSFCVKNVHVDVAFFCV